MLWVLLSVAVIMAINALLFALLSSEFNKADSGLYVIGEVDGVAQVTGVTTLYYVYVALIALGSYPFGGMLVGWMSPGETIKEPAFAALIAIGFNAVTSYLQMSQNPGFQVGGWAVGVAIAASAGFVLALGGAWVGERLQGETTEKMRERGELPPV